MTQCPDEQVAHSGELGVLQRTPLTNHHHHEPAEVFPQPHLQMLLPGVLLPQ